MIDEARLKLAQSVSKIEIPGDSRWNRWLKSPAVENRTFQLNPGKTVPKEIILNFISPELIDFNCFIPGQELIFLKAFERFLKVRATKIYASALPVSKTYRLFFSVLYSECSENLIPFISPAQLIFEKIFTADTEVKNYFLKYAHPAPEITDLNNLYLFDVYNAVKIKNYFPKYAHPVPEINDLNDSYNFDINSLLKINDYLTQYQLAANQFTILTNPVFNEWQYFDEIITSKNLLAGNQDIITIDQSANLITRTDVSESLLPGTSVIYVSLLSIKDFDISTKEIKKIRLLSTYAPVKIIYGSIEGNKVYAKKVHPLQSKLKSYSFNQIDSSDISPNYFEYFPISATSVLDYNIRISLNSRLVIKEQHETITNNIVPIDASEFIDNPVLAVPEQTRKTPVQRLFNYQQDGIDFLTNNSFAMLADEPGLGKKTQVVKALKILFRKGTIKNALIICSKTDVGNSLLSSKSLSAEGWEGTFYFWAPEIKIGKYEEKCQVSFVYSDVLSSVDQILKNFQKARFDCVVLDNINLPEINTSFFNEIRKLYPKFLWITTSLHEEEAENIISTYYEEKHLSEQDLKEKLNWIYLRRKKSTLSNDLPVKLETTKWFSLSEKQRTEYDSILFQGEIKIYSTLEKGNIYIIRPHIFTLLHQLLQVCNFIAEEKESEKSKYLINLILHTTDKVIVFSQYEKFGLDRLSMLLEENDIKHVVIKTNTSSQLQAELIHKFENTDIKVLLADAKAINKRITMKEFITIVHFDSWWNPAVKWQIEDKIRTSQGFPISIYNLITNDTIHEKIYSILAEKGLYVKSVLGQFSVNFISELISTEEWLNLLGVKTPEEEVNKTFRKSSKVSENFADKVKQFFGFLGYKKIKSSEQDESKNVIIFSKVNNTYEENILVKYKNAELITQEEIIKFFETISGYKNISHYYLVTSGEFASDCRKYIITKTENITLIDGKRISYFFSIFK